MKTVADRVIDAAKADCRIGPTVTRDNPEQEAHQRQCWGSFVATVFQCAGSEFKVGTTLDLSGKKCESYLPGVNFSNLDFNAFGQDIKEAMTNSNITDADFKSIAPAFEGTRLSLVKGGVPANKYTECAPQCDKGGDACIRLIPDGGGGGDAGDGGAKDSGTDAPADTGTD